MCIYFIWINPRHWIRIILGHSCGQHNSTADGAATSQLQRHGFNTDRCVCGIWMLSLRPWGFLSIVPVRLTIHCTLPLVIKLVVEFEGSWWECGENKIALVQMEAWWLVHTRLVEGLVSGLHVCMRTCQKVSACSLALVVKYTFYQHTLISLMTSTFFPLIKPKIQFSLDVIICTFLKTTNFVTIIIIVNGCAIKHHFVELATTKCRYLGK